VIVEVGHDDLVLVIHRHKVWAWKKREFILSINVLMIFFARFGEFCVCQLYQFDKTISRVICIKRNGMDMNFKKVSLSQNHNLSQNLFYI